jgi:hypothetical protein
LLPAFISGTIVFRAEFIQLVSCRFLRAGTAG